MKSQSVLVLGTYKNEGLVDALLDIGLAPLVRENIQSVLDKVRHERFGAIVVDQRYADIDVLELILNVRDVDEQIPVVVIGKLNDEAVRKTLAGQRRTTIIEDVEDGELTEKLERVIMSLEGRKK